MNLQLPVPLPDFFENNTSFSFKQNNKDENYKKLRKRPPKLYPKHDISFNRSYHNNEVHTISFKKQSTPEIGSGSGTGSHSILTTSTPNQKSFRMISSKSNLFDRSKRESYYEQLFRPIKKIGEGSFAEVFKVESKIDHKLYAVKMTKYAYRSDAYRSERLEEVRRLEEFSDHPHCLTMYNAWEQNNVLYMQLELCKDNLENYSNRHKHIPESMVWSVMLDLLLALKSLHDKNLVHLDIKLDNILMTEDHICKLADFGLVFDLNSGDFSHAMEGDSRYVAPELMSGNFCKANDIFSLGIAMMELSCNLQLPVNGVLWQQLRNAVFPEEIMQELSQELRDLIKRMMSPNPENRPSVDTLLEIPRIKKLQKQRRIREKLRPVMQLKNGVLNMFSKMKIFLILLFTAFKNFFVLKNDRNNFNNCILNRSFKDNNIQSNISKHEEDSDDDNFTPSSLRNISKISRTSMDDGDTNNNNSSNVTPTLNVSIPRVTPEIKIMNSTPLNHDGHVSRNLRKDLTRSCYELFNSPAGNSRELSDIKDTSSFIRKKLDFADDDHED